jgi:ParB family transcriptional regulator, chromosome partitioning protein
MPEQKKLMHVDPVMIRKNPENPRIIFREEDLDQLMRSIDQVGIQVPLSIYQKKKQYYLIDGERRWRCSLKLGLKTVPVIIEPEPSPLNNLLMMFNIHNVRVEWDLMALAYKIDKVKSLVLKEQGTSLSKKDLADLTGVRPGTIDRCYDLLALPEKYKTLILSELQKPKGEQSYTEDLFLEIKKGIATIKRYHPTLLEEYSENKMLDLFFNKFKGGVETNRVKFRDISKIARGELVGIPDEKVRATLVKYLTNFKYSIEEAYADSVEDAYSERSTERSVNDLIGFLTELKADDADDNLISLLKDLRKQIDRIVK